MKKSKFLFRGLRAIALAGVLVTGASATTMKEANLAQTVESTDVAFVGTVSSVEVVQVGEDWVERVTVHVSEGVIDSQAGQDVTWNQIRMSQDIRLPGMPEFKVNNEYMVFLPELAQGSELRAPFALGQGTFTIHRNTETHEAFARNQFGNSSLFLGLDTNKIAHELAATEAESSRSNNSMTLEERTYAKTVELDNLTKGAADLNSLIESVKFLDQQEHPVEQFTSSVGVSGGVPVLPDNLRKIDQAAIVNEPAETSEPAK